MNDNAIQDLKQFISTTISQQTSEITERLDNVEHKLDDISQSVATAIEISNDAQDVQIKDHDQRISSLEHKAA
jgi:uncharacterized protein Yka (UPF0111/DUF47 family)